MYLNTHSYFSFKYGTIKTVELLVQMQRAGVRTFALTDINSTAASLNFVRMAPKYDVKPVLGIDFRNGANQLFVAIAKNNEGFKELNDYLSKFLHSGEKIPGRAPAFQHAFVVYPFQKYTDFQLRENEFIGIKPADLIKLVYPPHQMEKTKLVMLPTATFRSKIDEETWERVVLKKDFNAHRLLRAIDNNTLLSKLPKTEEGSAEDFIRPVEELKELYRDHPYVVTNTEKLLGECSIHFDFEGENLNKNQRTYCGSPEADYQMLERLCKEGFDYRYPQPTQKILDRIQTELEVIKKQGFMSYFLINWRICQYARSKGYFYVGRGSGANSVVAYLLRITDVDPIELDLYFERFINLYRKNPPDFDIDFSWKDREDITNFIFSEFKNVSLLATYSTFQFRAIVRELGKVLGVPPHEIDHIQSAKVEDLDELHLLVLRYGKYIENFPSHLSIHAGGILISEQPIHYYTATYLPPKGFPTTHFDMVVAEDVGLYKFDILSQRGLGKIKESLSIISKNHPYDPHFDIHNIAQFKKDPKIKTMLREGQAIGCFYVESPAMRMLLKKLRVEEYLGLVAASSVIRPGVAKSGMMRQYILRFREPEKRKEAHPTMLSIMPETFGVMVYQEDVIKVAHYFADLTLAEADVLRRGMSGKYRSREEFQSVRDKYFENCAVKGHSHQLAAEIWRQIESFAGYAFAKGHSASYAVESYQSLFLKAYYPREYMVATMNNGGGFYSVELYAHEAFMHGADIQAPCVNQSEQLCTIYGNTIFMGLAFIGELEQNTVQEVLTERQKNGVFMSFDHFLKRVQISLDQLSLLIRINAFRFTGYTKKELLWEAYLKLGQQKKTKPAKMLFDPEVKHYNLPELNYDLLEDAFDQIELLGFPLCNPFHLLKEQPEKEVMAREMEQHRNKLVKMVGYLIHVKSTTTSGGKRMQFGTWIDREGHFIDSTHFPLVVAKYPFRGKGIYEITGKVVEEFDFFSLEVVAMQKLPFIHDPRLALASRHASNG
ncbi:DNA polymerase III subunit alpha [Roseivirga seohaensis]|uniref:DNA polymerase III subunit alpha n=1 Tax=Roseivirga seohaensis TaxID=1914963 RepID=UPI003BAC19A8